MWSEIYNIDYDQDARSTAWYDIVSRRRDEDLEHQLCQAASRRPGLRLAARVSRWLAEFRAARQDRRAGRGELKLVQKPTAR